MTYADTQNPYVQPPVAPVTPIVPVSTSPGLAFFLGFIPGVGAIYNGQYLKGLVHAVIFGLICSLLDSVGHSAGGPLLGIILTAFIFYMPFEAFHTAKRRLLGLPVEEFSSLIAPNKFYSRTPIGPILLILIGVFFLLDTLHLVEFQEIARFWPVLLIFAGAFMLYNRVNTPPVAEPVSTVSNEYVEPRQ
jgi:TM2 domain-containing membrane protein YozV